jgi:hypothetical protein
MITKPWPASRGFLLKQTIIALKVYPYKPMEEASTLEYWVKRWPC